MRDEHERQLRHLIDAAHEIVGPYADLSDAELAAAAMPEGRLALPIAAELAWLVLRVRAALQDFEERAP
jgi:hypothetical protein